MIETLDVVSGRRKAKTRGDTWVGPFCTLAQPPCASTDEQCSSGSVVLLTAGWTLSGQPRVFQLPAAGCAGTMTRRAGTDKPSPLIFNSHDRSE
jgi:hypothetical protein